MNSSTGRNNFGPSVFSFQSRPIDDDVSLRVSTVSSFDEQLNVQSRCSMDSTMTLSNKYLFKDLQKTSSPVGNSRASFSPDTSSLATLSPESSNSVSSPDRSFLHNVSSTEPSLPTVRLIDYFVVSGLDKFSDVEPIVDSNDGKTVFDSVDSNV